MEIHNAFLPFDPPPEMSYQPRQQTTGGRPDNFAINRSPVCRIHQFPQSLTVQSAGLNILQSLYEETNEEPTSERSSQLVYLNVILWTFTKCSNSVRFDSVSLQILLETPLLSANFCKHSDLQTVPVHKKDEFIFPFASIWKLKWHFQSWMDFFFFLFFFLRNSCRGVHSHSNGDKTSFSFRVT